MICTKICRRMPTNMLGSLVLAERNYEAPHGNDRRPGSVGPLPQRDEDNREGPQGRATAEPVRKARGEKEKKPAAPLRVSLAAQRSGRRRVFSVVSIDPKIFWEISSVVTRFDPCIGKAPSSSEEMVNASLPSSPRTLMVKSRESKTTKMLGTTPRPGSDRLTKIRPPFSSLKVTSRPSP